MGTSKRPARLAFAALFVAVIHGAADAKSGSSYGRGFRPAPRPPAAPVRMAPRPAAAPSWPTLVRPRPSEPVRRPRRDGSGLGGWGLGLNFGPVVFSIPLADGTPNEVTEKASVDRAPAFAFGPTPAATNAVDAPPAAAPDARSVGWIAAALAFLIAVALIQMGRAAGK